jgi:nitrate/nitrite-specific signal transduction histidine kinase
MRRHNQMPQSLLPARGTTVTERLSVKALTVLVAENGSAISDHDLAHAGSLGSFGMRERAALLGSHVDVRRRRPGGTVISPAVLVTSKPVGRGSP